MTSSCSGLDEATIEQAHNRTSYEEMFLTSIEWYNTFVYPFIYVVLCLSGVLANICIIVVLLRPSMRKNPFNLFLNAIAICDMTLMASYFIYKQVEICHPWYFEFSWIVFTYAYAVLSVFVHSASLWMTVNMAVLRYLVLRTSASSNSSLPKMNTYSAATISITIAIIVSLIGSAPNMLRYKIHDNGMTDLPSTCLANDSYYAQFYSKGQQVHAYTLSQPLFWNCIWERFSFWTAGLMLKLIPCLLLTIFMTLLVRMLIEARERRQRLCQGSLIPPPSQITTTTTTTNHTGGISSLNQRNFSTTTMKNSSSFTALAPNLNNTINGNSKEGGATSATCNNNNNNKPNQSSQANQAERTTAMLTIIVAVFLITELPQGILVLAIGINPKVRFTMHHLANVIDLLSLLNSSVNFILYATMSNLFRNEFYQTFSCLNDMLKKGRRSRRLFLKKRRRSRRLPPSGATIIKNEFGGEGATNLLNNLDNETIGDIVNGPKNHLVKITKIALKNIRRLLTCFLCLQNRKREQRKHVDN